MGIGGVIVCSSCGRKGREYASHVGHHHQIAGLARPEVLVFDTCPNSPILLF